jgi:hypothetical protein
MACGKKEKEFTEITHHDTMRTTAVIEGAGIQARVHELVPLWLW